MYLRFLLIMMLMPLVAQAQSTYDKCKPFGFCTMSSRTLSSSTYNITGGGCYSYPVTGVDASKVITLTATGSDQTSAIQKAIKNYSVIIFDGSKGEFIFAKTCGLSSLSGKTLLGINGATLRTQWYLTDEIRAALDAANVKGMSSSSGTGGTLSNGNSVSEEREFHTRQIIIDITGDEDESCRSCGVFSFSGCENIIVRNLKFVGPGAVDIGGSDLISFSSGTKHCWVDHCDFCDGTDGNFDITQKSDFNTVSWCRFHYTDHSYIHQNTNLIGSSDSETTGYLNTTFAYNNWGEGCSQRMPMARVGKIHMLNNYYTCTSSSATINPRKNSEFLIEGNYFVAGIYNHFSESGAKAWTWKDDNIIMSGFAAPEDYGTVTVPYTYTKLDANIVPQVLTPYVGATIFGNSPNDTTTTIPDVSPSDTIITPTVPTTAGTPLSFEARACYSKLVIDSRLNSFYANLNKAGFGRFNDEGEQTETEFGASSKLDYVPGLVGKAVIEAVDYYKDNKHIDVKPWYYAVQNYACKNDISANGKAGKSFDDLNAVKLYFKLRDLAAAKTFPDGALYSNETTVTTADTRFADGLGGIKTANDSYSIKATVPDASPLIPEAAIGGWWHKASYVNQMWCDGQYMGPALLAQMINGYAGYTPISSSDNIPTTGGLEGSSDWDLITKQFTICWHFLWDADKELLFHAFSATPTDSYAAVWADPETYHSKEYWGRAEGWYFLALVDILEEMQKAGLTSSDNYTTLHGYLEKVAAGLAKRQDSKTGCWYQLLQYDDTFYADSYGGSSYDKTYNYLESSASAIFLAAYMKGMRLGLLSNTYTDLAKKGYEGFIENFMVSDGDGGVHIINSCRSAGVGGSNNRDGSAAYYLLGPDVSMVKLSDNQTEGKVLGAFILAATEYERSFIYNKEASPTVDVNGDGKLDKEDISIIIGAICSSSTTTTTYKADLNNDGTVDVKDVNTVIARNILAR